MLIATITTDAEGRLTAGSTCTIDGRTIPVPDRGVTRAGPHRIWAAITSLGYVPVDYYGSLTTVDGGVTVTVAPTA